MDKQITGIFTSIEGEIVARWEPGDRSHLGNAAASALAVHRDALSELDPARCLVWALHADLPAQPWANPFGDPAITVVHNEHFRIDLLYWNHNASPTHKHASCGAFAALYGPRLHQVFEFGDRRPVDEYTCVGDLTMTGREVLRSGDVREIQPGLIHDLFWLARPSVTVSVRCNYHPGPPEQPWEYWAPGLSLMNMKLHRQADIARKAAASAMIRRASPAAFAEVLHDVVATGTPNLVFHVALDALASPSAETWSTVIVEALGARDDAFAGKMSGALPNLRRKARLYPVYTADVPTQLVVAMLWAGASVGETAAFVSKHVPHARSETFMADARRRIHETGAAIPELAQWAQ